MAVDGMHGAGPSVTASSPPKPSQRFRIFCRIVAGLIVVSLLFFGIRQLRYELRSYALLAHFVDPEATGPLLRLETDSVSSEDVSIPTEAGTVPGRLYLPLGVAKPPGIVVLPGIHRLGITDPRFVNFSRALAGSGYAVLTPTLAALADYHVDAAAIDTIGAAPAWLEQRLGTGPVTVIALSFSGGLALLAACDPRYAPHMRALVLFGGYEDLARVSRFLATGQEEFPDGSVTPAPAHDYGASVFVYAHLSQFFEANDIPAAHEALKYWLWEEPQNAQPWLEKLSPSGRNFLDELMARRIDLVRPQLLEAIRADTPELAALSPHGHIANLRVPVFILHGATDTVIPPAESLWLEREVPRRDLRAILITPAFTHVDLQHQATWIDDLRLVHFISGVLQEAS
jgi:pimeloyl-ACP methyl ester carboxylesterase